MIGNINKTCFFFQPNARNIEFTQLFHIVCLSFINQHNPISILDCIMKHKRFTNFRFFLFTFPWRLGRLWQMGCVLF